MARLAGSGAKRVVLMIFAVLVYVVGTAKADFIFGEPTNLGSPVNTEGEDGGPNISADGLTLYYSHDADIYMTTRATLDAEWEMPLNLGSTVNTAADDWAPSLSRNGLELFFTSKRSGGPGGFSDIWLTTRATQDDEWRNPEPLGPEVNTSDFDGHPSISSDGLQLFFCTWDTAARPGFGSSDIWVTSRASLSDPWAEPENLGGKVNSSAFEGEQGISSDGLCLFFSGDRPGGSGGWDLWMATRRAKEGPWGDPVNLGPKVNSPDTETMAEVSGDGSVLYFTSDRPGGFGAFDIWQTPILPIIDFNGDGLVEGTDIDIMIDCWGTDDSLCDIGPMPWGDGVVDVEDLVVLVEHIVEARATAVE